MLPIQVVSAADFNAMLETVFFPEIDRQKLLETVSRQEHHFNALVWTDCQRGCYAIEAVIFGINGRPADIKPETQLAPPSAFGILFPAFYPFQPSGMVVYILYQRKLELHGKHAG